MEGGWQGFEEVDLEALVDLGEIREIKKIQCGFLQDQVSWIFWPKKVQFAISEDGKTFQTVRVWKRKANSSIEAKIKEYSVKLKKKSARFIRIQGENVGRCPSWHQGASGKAWVFADEIVVQ
jgi:hypothetical protein